MKRNQCIKISLILSYLILFSACIPTEILGNDTRSRSLDIGLFAATASPATDDFRYNSKTGFGFGGIAIIMNEDKIIQPVTWLQISSFPEQTIYYDDILLNGDESDIVISLGSGLRARGKISRFRFFGELCLTGNLVPFVTYYDNYSIQVGYSGFKFGASAGAGIGFDKLIIGYRWIHGGGGNIIYNSFYLEYSFSLIKQLP